MANGSALLLSGGLDSIALLYWKRPDLALTVDYGQVSAEAEKRASLKVCEILGIEHETISIDCRNLGEGELADKRASALSVSPEWWPFRNQMLITFAAARLVAVGKNRLLIGSVKTDSIYADGTIGFVSRMNELLSYQEGAITLEAPAIEMTTVELIKKSGITPDILAWGHSCTRGNLACGLCGSCIKHRAVMKEIGFYEY